MDFKTHLKIYLSDEEINRLMDSIKEERTSSLILNTSKISNEDFITNFPKVIKHPFLPNFYYYDKNDYDFGKSYLFDNGVYYIMDASSALSSFFLDVKESDLILDLCSAPGGKTIFKSLTNNNLKIVANDIDYKRALTLSSNIEKLGIKDVTIITHDFLNSKEKIENYFGAIILDAPCSGSAMFRKNREFEELWSYNNVLKLASIQEKLLNKALDMLKPNGNLIYSTCSFSYEENEGVIDNILKTRDDIELIYIPKNDSFFRGKTHKETIYLFPFKYKGEGQFIAKIKKVDKNNELIIKNIKEKRNEKLDRYILDFIKENNLDFKYYKVERNILYGVNYSFPFPTISKIREGINIAEINKNYLIPSFNLAHYLNSENSIKLNEIEKDLYLKGETFNKHVDNLKNGYYIVSFNNINLGYIKYVNGVMKNLYPKGLRKR